MANKKAPYSDEEFMSTISDWFNSVADESGRLYLDTTHQLYALYMEQVPDHLRLLVTASMDVNLFAKCLVKAQIANLGGWWEYLPTWEPKLYEVRTARV